MTRRLRFRFGPRAIELIAIRTDVEGNPHAAEFARLPARGGAVELSPAAARWLFTAMDWGWVQADEFAHDPDSRKDAAAYARAIAHMLKVLDKAGITDLETAR